MGYDNECFNVIRAMYSLMVEEFINQEHIDIRAFNVITKPLRDRKLENEGLRRLGYDSSDVIREYLEY